MNKVNKPDFARITKHLTKHPFSKPLLLAYLSIGAISSIGMVRNLYALPDAPWQTSLMFIEDIDKLLGGDFWNVTWFQLSSGHALSGYRLYSYFSAAFFGLNTQMEIVFYWLIVAILASLSFRKTITHFGWPKGKISWFVLITISVMPLSLSGAGSRGMELGTYTGVLLALISFDYFSSKKPVTVGYSFVAFTFFGVLFFFLLGGYGAGFALGYLILWMLQIKTNTGVQINRLSAAAVISTVMLTAYFLAIRAVDATQANQGPVVLFDQIKNDFLFILKFLIVAPASGLVSSQTFENLGETPMALVAIGFGVICLLVFAYLFKLTPPSLSVEEFFPLFLAIYATGTAAMLLVFRPFGPYQLLSSWYSLHFKLLLIAAFVYVYKFLQTQSPDKLARKIILLFTSLVAVLFVFANIFQFVRGNFEREYFHNVVRAALSPELLKPDKSGMTQLVMTQSESIRAIEILQANKLSVYRDPIKALAELSSIPGLLIEGDYWADGWMGKDVSLSYLDKKCSRVRLTFVIPPTGQNRTVEIGGELLRIEGGELVAEFILPSAETKQSLPIHFESSRSPADDGVNSDTRQLTSRVDMLCLN